MITFLLTPSQESDIHIAAQLMEIDAVRRSTGQLGLRPKRFVADKGYTSAAFRNYQHRKNIRCTIPHRRNEHHTGIFNKQLYRKRNIIEALIIALISFVVSHLAMKNVPLNSLL